MKTKIFAAVVSFAFVCCLTSQPPSYADDHRGGDNRDGGEHGGYYKHYRRYPQDYFYYRKIYFYPQRRYYFYYDLSPDKVYYYDSEKQALPANPAYLPVTSIANMASQGVPDAVIISEIERTHSTYKLSMDIITYLRQNGASDRLIDFMIETGSSLAH